MPAFGAGDWDVFGPHQKTRRLVVPPPPGKTRNVEAVCVALVDKAAADPAGPRIQVFVRAPGRKIDPPIVEPQLDISGRVRKVEADDGAGFVPGFGDAPASRKPGRYSS